MINKLDDIPVPEGLEERVRDSLARLKRREQRRRRIWVACGSVAAGMVSFVYICVSNPVFASELPLIGHIFSRVQDEFAYSGDYSGEARILTPAEGDLSEYTVSDQGFTVTASEVYSDGISIFLSLQFVSDEPVGWLSRSETMGMEKKAGSSVLLNGRTILDGETICEGRVSQVDFSGLQIDQYRFCGMVKINLPESMIGEQASRMMTFQMEAIAADLYDDDGYPVEGEGNPGGAGLYVKGDWTIQIPVEISTEHLKKYEGFCQEGTGISAVYVTPYQVMAVCPQEDDREPGIDGSGLVLFDEDGLVIAAEDNIVEEGRQYFALKGRRPESLHFYKIMDWITARKTREETSAEKLAVGSLTLDISWM